MKYRLKEGSNVVGTYNEDHPDIEGEIEKSVRKMSFYRDHKKPVLAMGKWPGIALWKVKVTYTTDVEKDVTYKTEEVKS
jgi:hypothetical protein